MMPAARHWRPLETYQRLNPSGERSLSGNDAEAAQSAAGKPDEQQRQRRQQGEFRQKPCVIDAHFSMHSVLREVSSLLG